MIVGKRSVENSSDDLVVVIVIVCPTRDICILIAFPGNIVHFYILVTLIRWLVFIVIERQGSTFVGNYGISLFLPFCDRCEVSTFCTTLEDFGVGAICLV